MSTHIVLLLLVIAVLLLACSPPASGRPRDGAPVGAAGQPARRDGPPPTLSPPTAPGGAPQRAYALEQLTTSGMQPTMPAPSPSPAPAYVIVATGGAGVNLRTGPSTTGPIITTLAEGTPIDFVGDPVTAEGRSWRQIRSGGREGWVVSVVVRQR
ncbi:MAG TPA: SH3 domain-containing protein [Chloroflexota bacterium]|nr:SH3 domain-containing protein [Chloroflexota bacterium]